MLMSKIVGCNVDQCAYNEKERCGALAINVGGSGPVCKAFINAATKCRMPDVSGSVGACKQKDCEYNDCLLCGAADIRVRWNDGKAVCGTFKTK